MCAHEPVCVYTIVDHSVRDYVANVRETKAVTLREGQTVNQRDRAGLHQKTATTLSSLQI